MTDWYDEATLPHFERPPVFETAMALEFPPYQALDTYRLSQMQSAWAAQYSEIQDVPGAPPTPWLSETGLEIQLAFGPGPRRIWAAKPGSGLLVQTQSDRIILNWRRSESDGGYPGYKTLRKEFGLRWSDYESFLAAMGVALARPHLAEFTYVNVVPMAEGDAAGDVLALIGDRSAELPGEDRFVRFQFVRDVAQGDDHPFPAQLHISGEPQLIEGQRSLFFTVVCRTLLPGGHLDPLVGLDAAHALASRTFAGVITKKKQDAWGRL